VPKGILSPPFREPIHDQSVESPPSE